MNLGKVVSSVFKVAAKVAPGAIVLCSWELNESAMYDPEEGAMIETPATTCVFTAIKTEYKAHQLVGGIEAGDIPLLIDRNAVPSRPPVGAVISWDNQPYTVVNGTDTADLLYSMQMRAK